ncbi:hypothetical protein [Flavobacterium taihuense]|uniref:Uncharacterized protein n=1 Tax=Flavobacterium taihuense TaxID=2857508 RepID=A0ABS6XWX9_9FLAO|nr:hypothetical protein [Flavobacterium taihuense]MBW4361074.1 hypothetical protein [Flavobacterium taihuense]
MENNTLEDYKIAVKAKYETEKRGVHSSIFIKPSRAKLRSLCLEIFKSKKDQNDLNVFSSFFRFDFSPSCSGKLKGQTDKFRPIETFFKGETNLMDVEAINLAAILVDFQPRPFLKFSKSERNSPVRESEEVEEGHAITEEVTIYPDTIQFFNKSFYQKKYEKKIVILLLMVSLITTYYFAFQKKQCMQWSGDHFENVDCELPNDSAKFKIIPLDKSILPLKKVHVCDTTTFFKNGEAIIWYAKTENGIDFFNTHGRHPENDHALKPVTHYIVNKYVK